MDIIKFEFIEHELKKDVDYVNTIGINMSINGESMTNVVDVSSIIGACKTSDAELNLYTCTCGVPECAGFFYPVYHKKDKSTITWILPEEDEYSFSKKTFVFDNEQFENEVNQLLQKVYEYERKEIFLEQHVYEVCPEYLYDKDMKENQIKDLKKNSFESLVKESQKYHVNKEKVKIIIQKNFPKYVNKKIFVIYNEYESSIEYQLESLIGRILNEFPSRKNKKGYFANVKLAGTEFIKFINNEANQLDSLLKNSYNYSDSVKTSSFLPYDFFKKESEIDQNSIDEGDEDFDLDMNLLKFKITE